MKKYVFLAIAAILFGFASFAQQPVKPEGNAPQMHSAEQIAQRRADRLQQQLLLGKDQYKKVYKLCLEQAERDVARMQQQKAEKQSMAKAMKGILNEAQYERFEQMQNAPRHGHFGPRGGMNHKPHPANCDNAGKCPKGKPYCNKCEQPMPRRDVKADDSVKMGEKKYNPQKGERMRMVGDPRRNQNAYNYVEGAAEN